MMVLFDQDILKQTIKEAKERFFDFSGGVHISEEEVDRWINRTIKHLVERFDADPLLEADHSRTSCGNTLLVIFAYKLAPGNYEYEIILTRNYKSSSFELIETNNPFRV